MSEHTDEQRRLQTEAPREHEGLKLLFQLLHEVGWYNWDQNEPVCSCPASVTVKTVVPVVPAASLAEKRPANGRAETAPEDVSRFFGGTSRPARA